MILPDKVRILGRTFSIEYFDFNKRLQCNNQNANYDVNNQLIQIDNTLHREQQESSLIHELIHVISEGQDLGMTEHSVRLLESGLYQALNDNGFLKGE